VNCACNRLGRVLIQFNLDIEINADRERIWHELSDIAHHVDWMDDAKAIRFIGDQIRGVGTTFECKTRIAFITNTDVLRVTDWVEGHSLTIEHVGSVTGSGRIEVTDAGDRCAVSWYEQLTFPWFLGGVIGEQIARYFFTRVWKRDLTQLKTKCEAQTEA
jgi:hypothetical protein